MIGNPRSDYADFPFVFLNSVEGRTFGIFLNRQFIYSIPDDLIDAARIDGCGEFMIYRKVILPLIKPVVATLAIFTFLQQWNNFVWPFDISSGLCQVGASWSSLSGKKNWKQ